MNSKVKSFINKHADLIENNDWEQLYTLAEEEMYVFDAGELTMVMLDAGIEPFLYINKVPTRAFSGANIEDYTIPGNIVEVGTNAFSNCSKLTHITIQNNVKKIGEYAFAFCTALERVEIPDSVSNIGAYAFLDCTSLAEVTIGSGVKTIEGGALHHCRSLRNIIYKGTVEQWEAITIVAKHFWQDRARGCTIHCTDGSIVF